MTGVDPALYRLAAGQFATGILVVSASLDGIPHIMTVNAFTSVSLRPVLVLFCAEKIARFHEVVLATGSWAVSVLDEDSEKLSRWLATRGRPLHGQLDGVPYHPGPLTGAPILDAALSALECRTTAVHDGGDHSIIVGEVIGVTPPAPGGSPLVFYASHYRRLSTNGPGTNGPGTNGPGTNGPGADGPGADGPGADGPAPGPRPGGQPPKTL